MTWGNAATNTISSLYHKDLCQQKWLKKIFTGRGSQGNHIGHKRIFLKALICEKIHANTLQILYWLQRCLGAVDGHSIACVAALTEFTSTLAPALRAQIVVGYAHEPWCKTICEALPLREDCTDVDRLIVIDGRLLITDMDNLGQDLMDTACSRLGHLGYLKTIAELCQDFFWPKMARDV
jgi:hypothetical protein